MAGRTAIENIHYGYDFFLKQMPGLGGDELLHVRDEYHFHFAQHYKNLAHP